DFVLPSPRESGRAQRLRHYGGATHPASLHVCIFVEGGESGRLAARRQAVIGRQEQVDTAMGSQEGALHGRRAAPHRAGNLRKCRPALAPIKHVEVEVKFVKASSLGWIRSILLDQIAQFPLSKRHQEVEGVLQVYRQSDDALPPVQLADHHWVGPNLISEAFK